MPSRTKSDSEVVGPKGRSLADAQDPAIGVKPHLKLLHGCDGSLGGAKQQTARRVFLHHGQLLINCPEEVHCARGPEAPVFRLSGLRFQIRLRPVGTMLAWRRIMDQSRT